MRRYADRVGGPSTDREPDRQR